MRILAYTMTCSDASQWTSQRFIIRRQIWCQLVYPEREIEDLAVLAESELYVRTPIRVLRQLTSSLTALSRA